MPHQLWWHLCGTREVLQGSRDCSVCGARGLFVEWRLGMWEAVRVYHYVYELNPFGPHRPLADELLAPMRDLCMCCGGRAVLTIDEATWRTCPTCEGTGGIWNRPVEEVEAARRRVLARYPGAVLRWVDPRARVQQRGQESTVPDTAPSSDSGLPSASEPAPGPVPQPAAARGGRSSPRLRTFRRKGYSNHGLSFADVQRAFAEAEQRLGAEWRLKGRGHCRRVALDARYSPHAAKGAPCSWAWVTPRGMSRRRLVALAIVKRAAKILGVPARVLISREF